MIDSRPILAEYNIHALNVALRAVRLSLLQLGYSIEYLVEYSIASKVLKRLRILPGPKIICVLVGGVGSVEERRSLAGGLSLSCARPAAKG